MKIEAEYKNKLKETTVKDFPVNTTLWLAANIREEKSFPNCKLFLGIKIFSTKIVSLDTGLLLLNCENWKAIEADVKIVNN